MAVFVENSLPLSLSRLIKLLEAKEGVSTYQQIWAWTRNGEQYACILIKEFSLGSDGRGVLRLSYNRKDEPFEQTIQLISTRPHYGGKRWWFLCPATGHRCTVLYCPNGVNYFYSRRAFRRFRYKCQHESYWDRVFRKCQKAHDRCGNEWGDIYFPKPKGMHPSTHERRMAELTNLHEMLDMRLMMWGQKYLK